MMGRSAAAGLAIVLVTCSAASSARDAAAAQEVAGGGTRTLVDGSITADSGSAVRVTLKRPPAKPPFDALDAVGLPFKIAFFPLRLLGRANAELIGLGLKLAEPPEIGLFDRVAAAGFRPAFGSIGPRSGMAAGLRIVRFRPAYLETAYSLRGSQRHMIGLDLDRPLYRLETGYSFERFAEPHFYGIGSDSRKKDESDYRLDRQRVSLLGTLRGRPLTFRGGVGYEDNRVARGFDDSAPDIAETFAEDLPFGVRERTEYFVFSISATLDQSHVTGQQQRGFLIDVSSSLFEGTDGTDSGFYRLHSALNGYLPLNPRQELALRGIAEINRGRDRGVPFTHLASIGGSEAGRAYKTDRFRDRDLLALMSEWRYEVWRELHERGRVESFLLLDAGAVDSRINEISTSDLRWSYGFGFRVVWGGELRWLIYLAFGDEGARLDADFGWVF